MAISPALSLSPRLSWDSQHLSWVGVGVRSVPGCDPTAVPGPGRRRCSVPSGRAAPSWGCRGTRGPSCLAGHARSIPDTFLGHSPYDSYGYGSFGECHIPSLAPQPWVGGRAHPACPSLQGTAPPAAPRASRTAWARPMFPMATRVSRGAAARWPAQPQPCRAGKPGQCRAVPIAPHCQHHCGSVPSVSWHPGVPAPRARAAGCPPAPLGRPHAGTPRRWRWPCCGDSGFPLKGRSSSSGARRAPRRGRSASPWVDAATGRGRANQAKICPAPRLCPSAERLCSLPPLCSQGSPPTGRTSSSWPPPRPQPGRIMGDKGVGRWPPCGQGQRRALRGAGEEAAERLIGVIGVPRGGGLGVGSADPLTWV